MRIKIQLETRSGIMFVDYIIGWQCLYSRTAATLQQRCNPALQFGYSGCRSHNSLHDPAAEFIESRLQGVLPYRAEALR
jgi:hypothetical protein